MVEATVRQPRRGATVPSETDLADAAFLELIAKGSAEAAIALLKQGQQINVADEHGETAVHKATRRGDKALLTDLLRYGAVHDHQDIDGVSPIMIAIQFGRADLVELLVAKGVNLRARTAEGSTLLHAAMYTGHEATVRALLLEPRVIELLELKDINGRTPLQLASFRSSKEVCEMLVLAGADTATRDERGASCTQLASMSGRRKSRDFFVSLELKAAAAQADSATRNHVR